MLITIIPRFLELAVTCLNRFPGQKYAGVIDPSKLLVRRRTRDRARVNPRSSMLCVLQYGILWKGDVLYGVNDGIE